MEWFTQNKEQLMAWFTQNWLWVVGGVILLGFIYQFTRPKKKKLKDLSDEQKNRLVAAILSKITNELEEVVDDAIGQHFRREDRHKIAMGMVAVMMGRGITPEQLTANKELFVKVMLEAIAILVSQGQIAPR